MSRGWVSEIILSVLQRANEVVGFSNTHLRMKPEYGEKD
jgi:hypothetical protein